MKTEKELKYKGKEVSYLLRHKKNFTDKHGYAPVTSVLEKTFLTREELDWIVDNNNKKRFEYMKLMNIDNKEGYVVVFESGFRMKIKFEDYCRLHSIVTNVSNKTIWEHLKNGLPFEELLDRVPDEFYSWVEKTKKELESAYYSIVLECKEYMIDVLCEMIREEKLTKKDFALKVKGHKYSGILFMMYDKKDYSEKIWNIVQPVYSKPFKDGVDES
jgi:RNA ligase